MLILALCAEGVFPDGNYCVNRLRGFDCFGRPNAHIKSWYFFQESIETQPLWAFNTGGVSTQDQGSCSETQRGANDGILSTYSAVATSLGFDVRPQAVTFERIVITWNPAYTAVPFTVTLRSGGSSGIQVFTMTISANATDQVYVIPVSNIAADYVLVTKTGDTVRIAEIEGYEFPASLVEVCPTNVTPLDVRGPVIATYVQRDSPPFYPFANYRWDQLTHIFYGPVTPMSGGNLNSLSVCEASYLRSLVCWAHAYSVNVALTIRGASSDFAFIADTTARATFFSQLDTLLSSLGATIDGVDIDWQWGADDYSASDDEKDTRVELFEVLIREVYNKYHTSYTITASLPTSRVNFYSSIASRIATDNFLYADWFHISAWDYTLYPPGKGGYGAPPAGDGEFDEQSGVQGPSAPNDVYNTMQYWLGRGLPRNRTLLGIPAFGTSYSIYTGGRQLYYSIMSRYEGFPFSANAVGYIQYGGPDQVYAKTIWALVAEKYGGIFFSDLMGDFQRGRFEAALGDRKSRGRMSLIDEINRGVPHCGANWTISWNSTNEWDPAYLVINQNDRVFWNWADFSETAGVGHNVAQTASASAPPLAQGGFYSGPPIIGGENGGAGIYGYESAQRFTKIFNIPGTYSYIDEGTGERGVIIVNAASPQCVLPQLDRSVPFTVPPSSASSIRVSFAALLLFLMLSLLA